MKHYGLQTKDGDWLYDDHAMIFWTTCRAVAEAQRAIYNKDLNDGEDEVQVMQFVSDEVADKLLGMFPLTTGTGNGTGNLPPDLKITVT